jgi:hypothetical protein
MNTTAPNQPIAAKLPAAKKLPYSISNFEALITEGYVYIDKTRFIIQRTKLAPEEIIDTNLRTDYSRTARRKLNTAISTFSYSAVRFGPKCRMSGCGN